MNPLYLDCEWNSHGGDLISMALVPEEGDSFYEVLVCNNPDPWVAEHVMPKLGKAPISKREFQEKLHDFLNNFDAINIIADWPEDISWFCRMLLLSTPGTRMNSPPVTMQILRVDSSQRTPTTRWPTQMDSAPT